MTDREGIEHNLQMTPDLIKKAVQEWTPSLGFDWPLPRPSWSSDVEQSYDAYKRDISAKAAREVDVAMVLRYFDMLEMQSRVFEELIAEQSLTVESAQGSIQSHPHLATFCRLVTTGIKLANEIGATPMARVKLGLYAVEGQSATIALHKKINEVSEIPVQVDLDGAEVVMSW